MINTGKRCFGSHALKALLPFGGYLATFVEMYADESYGGDINSGVLCLAMYLYERDQSIAATEEWVSVLNDPDLPRPLRYFRMSDCAHAQGVFKGMGEHCDRIARKLIQIPRSRSIVGFSTTVDQGEYAQVVPISEGYPNPYTFLAQMCLGFVKNWIRDNNYDGAILYNFEAGHRHQKDANRIMNEIANTKRMALSPSYAGHAFVEKEKVPIVQSADLLAWHAFTDFKRQARGEGMRKDYLALGRPQDKRKQWTLDALRTAAPFIREYDRQGELQKLFKSVEASRNRRSSE